MSRRATARRWLNRSDDLNERRLAKYCIAACVICALLELLAGSAVADVITFSGRSYEPVDWTLADNVNNTATGTVGGAIVTLTTPNLVISLIDNADYSVDPAFGVLTFGLNGDLESIRLDGTAPGTTTIDFGGRQVDSLLFVVGYPNAEPTGSQFGHSVWDFGDSLAVSLVDTEIGPSGAMLQVSAGNIVDNPGASNSVGDHISGVFRVDGEFSSLAFSQTFAGFTDHTNVALAVDLATVPEPSALALMCVGLSALFLNCKLRRGSGSRGASRRCISDTDQIGADGEYP